MPEGRGFTALSDKPASDGVWGTYGYARGKIDEVKIWNYTLSQDDIIEEYLKAFPE